jgi:hypothetical protein
LFARFASCKLTYAAARQNAEERTKDGCKNKNRKRQHSRKTKKRVDTHTHIHTQIREREANRLINVQSTVAHPLPLTLLPFLFFLTGTIRIDRQRTTPTTTTTSTTAKPEKTEDRDGREKGEEGEESRSTGIIKKERKLSIIKADRVHM